MKENFFIFVNLKLGFSARIFFFFQVCILESKFVLVLFHLGVNTLGKSQARLRRNTEKCFFLNYLKVSLSIWSNGRQH